MVPLVGDNKPISKSTNVLFPVPVSPIIPINSFFLNVKETFFNTGLSDFE